MKSPALLLIGAHSLATALALALASPAFADQALASKHACTACHAADRKLVGPSFKDISARYASDAGAAERLAAKIRAGGVGAWGAMPMPPNASIPEADAKALVTWILNPPRGKPAQ